MEKSCHSSATDSCTTANTSSANSSKTDHFIKQLKKTSHKISKPIRKPAFHSPINQTQSNTAQNPSQEQQQQHLQQQPPVYNINKTDFRDVVQKLTGSPAHDWFSTPPPIQTPKPQSTRLQKIRPPPLPQLNNRTPILIPTPPLRPDLAAATTTVNPHYNRPKTPFSPIPPFPIVSAAAESPISAYMRYRQTSIADGDSRRISGFSPVWNAGNAPPVMLPSPPQPVTGGPAFPMGFGHIPSPRSPYSLLSPSLLFSLMGGLAFPGLPPSPRLPVPSPGWRDL